MLIFNESRTNSEEKSDVPLPRHAAQPVPVLSKNHGFSVSAPG